jgi:putative AlgH/UPF0301 family transcriptional regulator
VVDSGQLEEDNANKHWLVCDYLGEN